MHSFFLTLLNAVDKIRALMSTDTSQPLNPLQLASAEERFEGKVALKNLPRINNLPEHDDGTVSYHINFEKDAANRARIYVNVQASLNLVCQRCLRKMQMQVDKNSWLTVLANKSEMTELPEGSEPIVLDETETLTIDDLVQDELLLAIPLAPVHNENACSASEEIQRIKEESKVNPFAVLADLKKKTN